MTLVFLDLYEILSVVLTHSRISDGFQTSNYHQKFVQVQTIIVIPRNTVILSL